MNTDTGHVYRGQAEIDAARRRGEAVVPVSQRVAATMEAGNRAQRRAARFGGNRGATITSASRRLTGRH